MKVKYVVVDELPENCKECQFRDYMWCCAKDDKIDVLEDIPDDCPLAVEF